LIDVSGSIDVQAWRPEFKAATPHFALSCRLCRIKTAGHPKRAGL